MKRLWSYIIYGTVFYFYRLDIGGKLQSLFQVQIFISFHQHLDLEQTK